jgi:hypothetical protein
MTLTLEIGMSLELSTVDMYRDKIGQAFLVEETDVPAIALTLAEAKTLPNYAGAPRTPFSLVFTAPGDVVLPQRMYALRHAALGLQTIFLVPIGRDGGTMNYEAIFN